MKIKLKHQQTYHIHSIKLQELPLTHPRFLKIPKKKLISNQVLKNIKFNDLKICKKQEKITQIEKRNYLLTIIKNQQSVIEIKLDHI